MKLTKDNVKVGMTIYWMHYTDGPIHKGAIQEIVDDGDEIWYFRMVTGMYVFPADRGVPGFAYDDRMCQIYTNKRDAEYVHRMAASLKLSSNMNWIWQDVLDAACLNGPQRRIIK